MNAVPLSQKAKEDLLSGTARRFVEKYIPDFFREC